GSVHVRKKQVRPADGLCAVEGCDSEWLSKGYCKNHYERFQKYGDPLGKQPRSEGCAVANCDGKHKGLGYCLKHYRRLKLYGDPEFVPESPAPYACKIDGCTDRRYALDLCQSHY